MIRRARHALRRKWRVWSQQKDEALTPWGERWETYRRRTWRTWR